MDELVKLTQTFLEVEKKLSNRQLKEFRMFVEGIYSCRNQLETNKRLFKGA
jgi:hypothetical protein